MLSEGHGRAERGTDVIVASARTHGRAHTAALLAGLEVIPPVTIPRRGTAVAEMDLGAVLARRPAVALVDDLARRNVPGAGHAARVRPARRHRGAGSQNKPTAPPGRGPPAIRHHAGQNRR
jgi:two-component system sensor histidine kinase KdpD